MRLAAAAFLFLFLVSFAGTADAAVKVTSTSTPIVINSALKDATVNLYCRLKAGKKIFSSSGSGVYLNDRGVILTNAHVAQYWLLQGEKGRVTGWCAVRPGSPAEEMYTAEVLYFPPSWLEENAPRLAESTQRGTGENDFALLYITGLYDKKAVMPARFPALPFGTGTYAPGTKVNIAGYPTETLDFKQVRNKLSSVVAQSEIIETRGFDEFQTVDILTLAGAGVAQSGVSGGLVADETNKVIGIINAKSVSRDTPVARGLSIDYIDRQLRAQTGLSLSSIVTGDLKTRAAITKLFLPADQLLTLANGLRKKK